MYEFWYDYVRKNMVKKQNCYMDKDSHCISKNKRYS